MAFEADDACMNGWLKAATLVPAMGLIPLGFAVIAPFIRLAPVAVRSLEASRSSELVLPP